MNIINGISIFLGQTGRALPENVEAPPLQGHKRTYNFLSNNLLQELERCEKNFSKIIKFQ